MVDATRGELGEVGCATRHARSFRAARVSPSLRRVLGLGLITLGLGGLLLATSVSAVTRKGSSKGSAATKQGETKVEPAAAATSTPVAVEAAPAQQTWLSADDLRLGDFKVPNAPYPFPLLGDERAKEIYVDRDGNLYKERKYSGVIQAWGQSGALRRGRCQVVPQTLDWVGFQNNFDSSRVFIAVQGEACGYVYRPDELHIVIDLPAVKVENPNLLRDILTGAFPTPVQLIHVEELGGRGTRITIALREPRSYLSAHIGKYVFVDVSR